MKQAAAHRRRRRAVAGMAVAVAALLGACSGGDSEDQAGPPEIDPTPQSVQEALPEADDSGLWLPYQFGSLALVDPPWDSATVAQLNGLFAAMQPEEDTLTFSVTDSEGTTIWHTQRATADTEFALTTTPDGTDAAVLTESDGDATTAAAYDLASGEELWGPVDVPGPLQGPGLTFAPAGAGGQTDAEVVTLSGATGERRTAEDLGATRILGEYDGTVLSLTDDALQATDLDEDGAAGTSWTLGLTEREWDEADLSAPPEVHPGAGLALLNTAPSADAASGTAPIDGAVLDLASGEVLAEGVSDVQSDPATGSIVYLASGAVHGSNPDSDSQWEAPVGESARLAAVGGAIVYVLDDDSVSGYNVLTGDVAEAYDPNGAGTLAVPELIAPSGAALLRAENHRYLATTLPGDDVDLTGQG